MPKYINEQGIAYLWRKIENKVENDLIYASKTSAEWNADRYMISEKNVLYIYTDFKTIEKDGEEYFLPGLKFGDGTSYLIDLPFLNSGDNSEINEILMDHINNNVIHITANERDFWNNKLNYSQQLINETLIFNRQ